MRRHLERLIPVFDLAGARDLVLDTFELVTRESLALDLDAPLPRFSTINNDGVPLEISLSLGGADGGLRLLTEIGVPGSSVLRRIQLTCARLGPVLHRLGLAAAAPALEQALAPLFPVDPVDLTPWHGGLWVALAFLPGGRSGLRLYVNAAVGDRRERWLRVSRLLARLGRMESVAALCELSPLVSAFAEPLGVAMEVEPGGIGRVKFYLRTTRVAPGDLEGVLTATGHGDGIAQLHQFLAAQRGSRSGVPPSSIVLSLEFPATGQRRVDVKIDACCHCLFRSDAAAHAASRQLIRDWAFPASEYEAVLRELAGGDALAPDAVRHHAFLGLGLAHGRAPRLNIYLKPAVAGPGHSPATGHRAAVDPVPPPPHRPAAGGDLLRAGHAAAERAIAFLLDRQSSCGQWIDFALPVGPSDGWVTAYVGLVLAELPAAFATAGVRRAIDRAAAWCLDAMGPDHGWGYNAFTGSDADSTAHAIRFLQAAGQIVPEHCRGRLRAFQRSDGGFATYQRTDPGDTWGHSHADVTPAALLALAGDPDSRAAVEAGVAYAIAQQDESGCWPSYWWRTHDYATRINVQALTRLGAGFRARACVDACARDDAPAAPFETALRLASLADLDALRSTHLHRALDRLLSVQQIDGSWPASPPMLRLTDPRCPMPWAQADAGSLYADPRRIFTTATVLAGLVEAVRRDGSRGASATPA